MMLMRTPPESRETSPSPPDLSQREQECTQPATDTSTFVTSSPNISLNKSDVTPSDDNTHLSIKHKANEIIQKLNETRSLTRVNKEKIIGITKEIIKLSKDHKEKRKTKSKSGTDSGLVDIDAIKNIIKKEVGKVSRALIQEVKDEIQQLANANHHIHNGDTQEPDPASIMEEIKKLQNNIDTISIKINEINTNIASPNQNTPTYADMTGKEMNVTNKEGMNTTTRPKPTTAATTTTTRPPVKPLKPALIIKSKDEVSKASETLLTWHRNTSFTDTDFAPTTIKLLNNKNIKVMFDNEQQRDIAMERTNATGKLTAQPSTKLQPMIIIKGISKINDKSTLTDIILSQNETLKDTNKNELNIKFTRKNKNENLYNAIMITSPQAFNKIANLDAININHQRIHWEIYTPLLQCYNCLQFGHTRKRCSETKMACSHCAAEGHRFADCPEREIIEKLKCYNCIKKNNASNNTSRKPQQIHDISHTPTSDHCPIRQKQLNTIREITDFGIEQESL